MRTALLRLLPLAGIMLLGLPLATACSGSGDLPTGSWHHGSGTAGGPGSGGGGGGGGGTAAGSTGGGSTNGGTASSGGGGEGSSSGGGSGGAASSGGGAGSSGGSSGGTTGGSSGGVGSSNGGGSSGTSSGASSSGSGVGASGIAVTVDQTALQVQLLAQTTLTVSVAPNGYRGTVQLSPGTLPAGVTATFDNASLTLDGATTATAKLTLKTDTNAPPGAVPLSVDVSAGGTTKTAAVDVTVESTITLHIPAGVNKTGATIVNPDTTAFGPYPIAIVAPQGISSQNPVTVYFMNDDTVSHEIHADAQAQGFGHDPGSFGAGKMDPYVRKVNAAGTYDFYLHDQGSPITIGRIHIQ